MRCRFESAFGSRQTRRTDSQPTPQRRRPPPQTAAYPLLAHMLRSKDFTVACVLMPIDEMLWSVPTFSVKSTPTSPINNCTYIATKFWVSMVDSKGVWVARTDRPYGSKRARLPTYPPNCLLWQRSEKVNKNY